MKKIILVVAVILFFIPIVMNLSLGNSGHDAGEMTKDYSEQIQRDANHRLLTAIVDNDGLKIRVNALIKIKDVKSKEVEEVNDYYIEVINSPVPIEFKNLSLDVWADDPQSKEVSYAFSADARAIVKRFSSPQVSKRLESMGFSETDKTNEGYIYSKYVEGAGKMNVK